MGKLIAPIGIVLGAAVWFLLFVILGTALGTSFIAGGCVVAAAFVAAGMVLAGPAIDAPLTASGVLLGITAFVILEVVLSLPMWIGVVAGLGVMGLYDVVAGTFRPRAVVAPDESAERPQRYAPFARTRGNGHDGVRREPVGAR